MSGIVGIDLGGTNIKAGIVDEHGTILVSETIPTHVSRGPDKIIESMISLTQRLVEKSGVSVKKGGIGAPGTLDQKTGIIHNSPNLPHWGGVRVVERMNAGTHIDFVLENDANAACMGEKIFGIGKPFNSIVHLTLGTGIGGGLFLDGKLFRGARGAGAELGHMTIDYHAHQCGCGSNGCLEALASDSGIRSMVALKLAEYPDSLLQNYNSDAVNFKVINELRHKSDSFAQEIYTTVITALGVGIANYVNIFNPDAVILSGGLIKAGQELLDDIVPIIHERAFDILTENLEVLFSTLGDSTGVLGAAACVIHN